MMMWHLGGGLPPVIEFLSPEALFKHTISRDNFFSEENLNARGFFTDEQFIPQSDGFIPWVEPFTAETLIKKEPVVHPQSALQKYIWHLATKIPLQAHTSIG